MRKPDLLLLDEPTSALNVELVDTITERVTQYCIKYGIGMAVISHNDSFEQYFTKVCHKFQIVAVDGKTRE